MRGPSELISAFDRLQQRRPVLGFPLAVLQKYFEDQGGYLAATITYYAFFAIFPLLLVLTTVLGFVLRGHTHLYTSIVDSALGQLPVIGNELQLGRLRGNGLALALGLMAALWAGMGVFLASQNAMNRLWGVPHARRPDFLRARGRSLVLLLLLGGGMLATTVLGAVAGAGAGLGADFGALWKIASFALGAIVNFGLFWVGFHVLAARGVGWRQLRGGAIAAAILYGGLQALGGFFVDRVLRGASNTYGTFALVIGLLSWIYLSVHVMLLAAEANVVAARRLWPRSFSILVEQPATAADRAALAQRDRIEERRQDETISVDFGGSTGEGGPRRDASGPPLEPGQ